MPFIVGIDGGGTRTTAVLATPDGNVLAMAHAGPANYLSAGRTTARESILSVIQVVCDQVGASPADCIWTCAGFAAIANEADRAVYAGIIQDSGLVGDLIIESDVVIAWAVATEAQPGIALISGTGASCFGMNANGERHRALGWDYLLADQGSGYWIGQQGLQAAFKAYDGRIAPTALLGAMLAHYGLQSPTDMLRLAYDAAFTKRQIAGFARAVVACASANDSAARAIIQAAAAELGAATLAVARKLGLTQQPIPVGLIGGVFEAGAPIIDPIAEVIRPELPEAQLVRPALAPVFGALILGAHLHQTLSQAFLHNLAAYSA